MNIKMVKNGEWWVGESHHGPVLAAPLHGQLAPGRDSHRAGSNWTAGRRVTYYRTLSHRLYGGVGRVSHVTSADGWTSAGTMAGHGARIIRSHILS
jgi:hypothetical protein